MPDDLLSMEARLKDYLSTNLKTIENNLRNFTAISNREVRKQNEGWNLLQSGMSRVLATAAGFIAFSKVASYMKSATAAITTQVEAEAQLTSALGYTNESLVEYAKQIQATSTIGDEQILQAEALIGSFIKEEDSIKSVTKAAVDFAIAKRMDVATAADLFTKTIISSTNALSRYGITVKDTNIVEDRLSSLVKNVNNAYGGRAEALAKTDVGKLKQLNNLIGDQQELIGEELLPVMKEWYSLLLDITTAMKGPVRGAISGLNTYIKLLKGETLDLIQTQNLLIRAQSDQSNQMKNGLLARYSELENRLVGLKNKLEEIENPKKSRSFRHGSFLDRLFGNDPDKINKEIADITNQMSLLSGVLTKTTPTGGTGGTGTPTTTMGGKEEKLSFDDYAASIGMPSKANIQYIMEEAEKAKKKIDNINKIYNDLSIQQQEQTLEDGISLQKLYSDRYMQIADEINSYTASGRIATIQDQVNDELTLWKYYTDTGLVSQQQFEDMRTLLTEQGAQKRTQIYLQEAQNLAMTFTGMLSNWNSYLSTKRNTEYQTEVERIRSLHLSKRQEEKLLKEAENKSKEKAKRDQLLSASVAAINGAVAITKAYSEAGPFLGTAYALMIGASTALQIATIKSQKLAKGGTVNTFLGEQGSELVPGYGMINAPSYHRLPIGTHVYNNTETRNMMGGNTFILQLPPGAAIDTQQADRIESLSDIIGEVLIKAHRDGRLEKFKAMR